MVDRLVLGAPGLAVNACIPSRQSTRSNRMYHPLLLGYEANGHLHALELHLVPARAIPKF